MQFIDNEYEYSLNYGMSSQEDDLPKFKISIPKAIFFGFGITYEWNKLLGGPSLEMQIGCLMLTCYFKRRQ